MNAMATKPSNKKKPDDGPIVVTFRCEGPLRVAFDQFRDEQRIPPAKSDVLIVALQEFLQKEGYYPPEE